MYICSHYPLFIILQPLSITLSYTANWIRILVFKYTFVFRFIRNQREKWHKEIDIITTKLISDVDEIDSKLSDFLNKQENEIKLVVSEITQVTAELNKLLNSNDVRLISAHISRNAEFRTRLSQFTVTLPSFTPQMISKEQLNQQFGSLSTLSINIIDESSSTCRQIIDKPCVISDINTEYGGVCSVSCLSDDKIWICA